MTLYPADKPLPNPVLRGLLDRGLVVASNRMICGPLGAREAEWGTRLSKTGRAVAEALRLESFAQKEAETEVSDPAEPSP